MLQWIAETSRKLGLLRPAYRVFEWLKSIDPKATQRDQAFLKGAQPLTYPLPPADLRVVVAGTPDIHWFLLFGEKMSQLIRVLLAEHGLILEHSQAILEFGCGCGRVLRHFGQLRGPALYGTDYNPQLIEWCRHNLTFAHFDVNRASPPLIYTEAMFDLVYASSVFTHLAEPQQLAWMVELRRILRPGGYLLFTTMGESFLNKLSAEEQARFRAGQLVVQYDDASGLNLCGTYHPREYVENRLTSGFEVLSFLPVGSREHIFQDVYLLHKH